MPANPIPAGFHSVTPYLLVDGVAGLIDFLKKAFDANETERMARPDGSIMHAEVRIGDSVIMMGEPGEHYKPMPGSFYMYVKDVDAVYNRAVGAGATSLREPTNEFYGDRVGGIQDLCGNQWWIASHVEDVPQQELPKRLEERMKQSRGA